MSEKPIDPFEPFTAASICALQAHAEHEAGHHSYSLSLLEKAAFYARRGLGVSSHAEYREQLIAKNEELKEKLKNEELKEKLKEEKRGTTERRTTGRRIFHARQLTMVNEREGRAPEMPAHPRDDGAPRPKWNSKWDFDRADKRVRIIVVAYGPEGEEETIDAREFIERLGEDHRGTTFAIHVETEQIGETQLQERHDP